MENDNKKAIEEVNRRRKNIFWNNSGLLLDVPEDRKSHMVNCYNYLFDSGNYDYEDTLSFSIIHKVAKEVDLINEDIDQICADVHKILLKKVNDTESNYYLRIDCECEIIAEYSKDKIEEIKNRK